MSFHNHDSEHHHNVKRAIAGGALVAALGAGGLGTATAAPVIAPTQVISETAKTGLDAKLVAAQKDFKGGTVAITGTAKVGKTLTAKVTGLTPNSNSGAKYRYQWLRDGKPISGATSKTYQPVSKDAGKSLSVKLTASKSGYKDLTKTSATVNIKAADPDGSFIKAADPDGSFENPYKIGETARVGAWKVQVRKPITATGEVVSAGYDNPEFGYEYRLMLISAIYLGANPGTSTTGYATPYQDHLRFGYVDLAGNIINKDYKPYYASDPYICGGDSIGDPVHRDRGRTDDPFKYWEPLYYQKELKVTVCLEVPKGAAGKIVAYSAISDYSPNGSIEYKGSHAYFK